MVIGKTVVVTASCSCGYCQCEWLDLIVKGNLGSVTCPRVHITDHPPSFPITIHLGEAEIVNEENVEYRDLPPDPPAPTMENES